MSLVNDMLEDLDRRAENGDLHPRTSGLQAVAGRRRARRVGWICAGLGALSACGIAMVGWIALAPANSASDSGLAIGSGIRHQVEPLPLASQVSESSLLPPVDSAPPAPPQPRAPSAFPLANETTTAMPNPVAPTPDPAESAAIPVEPAASPAESAAIPVEPAASPAESAAIPVEPAASPAESAAIPVTVESAPTSSGLQPPAAVALDPAPTSTELAAQLIHEGEQLLAARRLEAGLDAWRRALDLDPARTSLYPRGARQLLAAGHRARARAWLEPGRSANPEDASLRALAARIELELAGPAAALRLLEAPLPALDDAAELHSLRAAILQREGRHREALEGYRALVARFPERGRLWFGLAVSAEALERPAEADVALQHALEDSALPAALARHANARLDAFAQPHAQEPTK